ncbi:MAG: hypothetical protein Kow00108_12960 [Calditrichia bacterium]
MDKKVVPYIEKQENCPVCGSTGLHYYLRDRQYVIQKRDTDQFPLEYDWYNPKFKKYNPLYFFLYYCPNCHFADERMSYINPFKYNDHQKFSILKTMHKERYQHDPVIQLLSNHIDYPELDYTSAINLHMLAIYIQLAPNDKKYLDDEKIARFYHRLAWLFRENVYVGKYSEEEELLNTFTINYDNYQSAFLNSLSGFEKLKEWWNERIEAEKEGTVDKTLSPFEMEIRVVEKEVGRLLDHLLLNNPRIYEIITKFKEKYIQTNNLVLDQSYKDFTSFYAFLQQVKKEWPLAPIDEMSALNQAAEFYLKLTKNDVYSGETVKLYKTYELIMAIYQKMKQAKKEIEIIVTAYNHAHKFREKAAERLKLLSQDQETPAHMITHMKSMIRRIDEMLYKWKSRRKELTQMMMKEERERAEKILAKYQDYSPEFKLEALQKAGIHKLVVKEIQEEIAPNQKGLFKKLFGS